MFLGSATVSVAPVGVSPAGFGLFESFFAYNAFGETPALPIKSP
jgi:hypothetical protein